MCVIIYNVYCEYELVENYAVLICGLCQTSFRYDKLLSVFLVRALLRPDPLLRLIFLLYKTSHFKVI